MLLMRDQRPDLAPATKNSTETAAATKLKDVDNLVAKTEVVYEAPGEEKGFFRRVVDTINPFSSSDSGKKEQADNKKSDDPLDIIAKKIAAEKKDGSATVLVSANGKQTDASNNTQLVNQIDGSLKNKGIDSKSETAALTPPPADLPKVEVTPPPPPTDTTELLGKIDTGLKKDGKDMAALPPPPEAAEGFKNAAAMQAAMVAKANAKADEPAQSVTESGLLGNIDQKLKSQGVDPTQFQAPPSTGAATPSAPKKEPVKKVELEPKVTVEKGPLFLAPTEVQGQQKAAANQEPSKKDDKKPETTVQPDDSGPREIPKALVRGPVQPAAPPPKAPEPKASAAVGDDDDPGVLDQLKQDADAISKVLNPFSW